MTQQQSIADVVRETQEYYDGPADEIYRLIWGDDVHMGTWTRDDDTLQSAMARTNAVMAEQAGIDERARVLDVGCGYGATALHLATEHGCEVVGQNISERELEVAEQLAKEQGLSGQTTFQWGDFHDIPAEDDSFDAVWSQEAFLHAVDKPRVLAECRRVLRPGGRLVISDLLVAEHVPEEERQAIYARVHSPEMWSHERYVAGLEQAGFEVTLHEDWSSNVARTYAAVRDGLLANQQELRERGVSQDQLDATADALQLWVDGGNAGKISQGFFVGVA